MERVEIGAEVVPGDVVERVSVEEPPSVRGQEEEDVAQGVDEEGGHDEGQGSLFEFARDWQADVEAAPLILV